MRSGGNSSDDVRAVLLVIAMVLIVGVLVPLGLSLAFDSGFPWLRIALFAGAFAIVYPFLYIRQRRRYEEAERAGERPPVVEDNLLGGPRVRLLLLLGVIVAAFVAQRLTG